MGSSKSSLAVDAASNSKEAAPSGILRKQAIDGGRGRESSSHHSSSSVEDAVFVSKSAFQRNESGELTLVDADADKAEAVIAIDSDDDMTEDETESEEELDSDDDDEDEDLEERMRILAEARALKNLAVHFIHPELPVVIGPSAFGRDYFSRPSAAEQEDNIFEEREAILADASALKTAAAHFAHPEVGVRTTDPTSFGRNYYGRRSGPEAEELGDAEEHSAILEDAMKLRKAAFDYLHPERLVEVDPSSFGHNYFNRPSAPEQHDEDVAENEDAILTEAAALKKLASDYAHPEKSLEADPIVFGCNYFTRPSAEEQQNEEDAEEQDDILADAAALKKLAVDYIHPEKTVEVDPVCFGRNYFCVPSTWDQNDREAEEEQASILVEAAALKKLAVNYAHPEKSVKVFPTCFGHNYFGRPSAVVQQREEAKEQDGILAEMTELKKLAADFAHPEKPVEVDPTCFGRNYFGRPSAEEHEDGDDAQEQDGILAEMAALKKLAVDFAHPERAMEVDPSCFGRNYFGRAFAEEQEDKESEEECATILVEMAALKKLAVGFTHPEKPVEVDPACFGRNYFGRPSAEEQDDEEAEEEQTTVLVETAALKQLAVNFAHPERPVEVDPACFGRNYFGRLSAEEQQDEEDANEQDVILANMKALKKLAVDFTHPEKPVEMDPTCFGRNHFGRPSAEEHEDEDDAQEQDDILADIVDLKRLAVDFAHPERPVDVVPARFGRNYFVRPSAEEQDHEDVREVKDDILADTAALMKHAVDFAHPENPVEVDPTCFGRNYFGRPSAEEQDDEEAEEEQTTVLAETVALKKLAVDFTHPEKPVEVDPTCFGRNYFGRPSAEEQVDEEAEEEQTTVLVETAALKQLAVDFTHPERPVEVDHAAFGRNYFNRATAQEQEDEDVGKEQTTVLAEVAALKKLAVDFTHPEKPVEVDPTCFGRNYFIRPSADEQDVEDVEDQATIVTEAESLKKLAVDFAHPERPVKVDPVAFGRNYFSRSSAPQRSAPEDVEEQGRILSEVASLRKLAVDYAHPEKPLQTTDATATGRSFFDRYSSPGVSEHISSSGMDGRKPGAEHSDNDETDHFDFDDLHEDLHAM